MRSQYKVWKLVDVPKRYQEGLLPLHTPGGMMRGFMMRAWNMPLANTAVPTYETYRKLLEDILVVAYYLDGRAVAISMAEGLTRESFGTRIHVYVNREYRRRGIGTRVIKRMLREIKMYNPRRVFGSPFSPEGVRTFNAAKVEVEI